MTLLDNPFHGSRVNDSSDFVPEWDVTRFGETITDGLHAALDEVRKNPLPSGSRRVHLLAGPPGHGKTHLLARVRRGQGDRIHLAYAAMTSDPERTTPTSHLRWCLVESLFESPPGTFAPLRILFATLLRPSLLAYFAQLDGGVRVTIRKLEENLTADPETVLELLAPVQELAPYHRLADSLRAAFPALSAPVLQAFVLGLSPAATDARAWLRGEEASLSEERRQELLLTGPAPDAGAILKATAVLFGAAGKVLWLCLDQMELLARRDLAPIRDLANQLMAWLQEIPNLLIAVGLLEKTWTDFVETSNFKSFLDRVQVWKIDPLTPDQAAALIAQRMESWDGREPSHPPGWPFDLDSVKRFCAEEYPNSRMLIDLCRDRFEDWLLEDDSKPIRIPGDDHADPEQLFLQEWTARYEKMRQSNRTADSLQEGELFEAFAEAIELARLGAVAPLGVELLSVRADALKRSNSAGRPNCAIRFRSEGKESTVLFVASKSDDGRSLVSWVTAMRDGLNQPGVVGGVAVWPKKKLSTAKGVNFDAYQGWVRDGKVRPFTVEEYLGEFHQALALRESILDARSGQFTLAGMSIDPERLRQLFLTTGVLNGLTFYQILFVGWNKPTAVVPTTAPVKAPASTSQPTPPAVPAPDPLPADPLQALLDKVVAFLRKKKQPVLGDGVQRGPTFIRLRVKLESDADVGKIKNQDENLRTQLSLEREPIIDSQAGYVSIDVQRDDRQTLPLATLLADRPAKYHELPAFPLGGNVAGEIRWLDLSSSSTCHLLLAGIPGSGKSEFLRSVLGGLAAALPPEHLQFILIDPKKVTFNFPGPSPYLKKPITYEAEEAIPVLQQCVAEMERRNLFLKQRFKTQISELDATERPARWVILIDEYANLMDDPKTKKQLESGLKKLSSMGRSAGIHVIVGTQRPEASVVTTLIRSNLPCRLSFQVATGKDSKIILGETGAEKLLSHGDFLYSLSGVKERLQGPLVGADELEKLLRVR